MANAQAEHGVIPKDAAAKINRATPSLEVLGAEIATETRQVGRGTVPTLGRLRAAVAKEIANYVHVGSTTQDIVDTGLAIQINDADAPKATSSSRFGLESGQCVRTPTAGGA